MRDDDDDDDDDDDLKAFARVVGVFMNCRRVQNDFSRGTVRAVIFDTLNYAALHFEHALCTKFGRTFSLLRAE